MNRLVILALFIVSGFNTYCQQSKPLQFREETFDFGEVKEDGGPVTHEFLFTNNSGRPARILTVQASCGCTTPAWSKEVVPPGKTGFIQASYNPKGRPGFFNKTLTVTTDLDQTPFALQIKGTVSTGGVGANADFMVANGNWRLKTGSFNLGKVYLKDEYTSRDYQFMNVGDKPITYTKFAGPAYVKIDVTPKTVAPGEKGHVKVSYNGKQRNQYGFQSDNVELYTDDSLSPVKSFSVYATLEDYFPDLKPEELAKAPQLKFGSASLDFGRIHAGGSATREISFTNTGKKELQIRALQGNCTCVTASAVKSNVKPGETGTIRIVFNAQDRKGTQQKAVTIYSNDPVNPVQRVTFSAYVEQD
jgi:hypothetical protein